MQFRSINDLYRDIWSNLHRLPADVDLVVGIPRSGMLVATIIALARNLPLADLDGFVAGRQFAVGRTRRDGSEQANEIRHILIVDDSSRTGSAMREARATLATLANPPRFTTCVVYGVEQCDAGIDLTLATVAEPRVFEWNVFHHPIIERACVDIDGVLCLDPQAHENDDGPRYLDFLGNAQALHRPRREIGMLVTSRLEKYRRETEDWLHSNGFRYRKLEMLDLPDAETRRRHRVHAGFKAGVYSASDSPLFIESELPQAREIAYLSGKPVLSLEGPQMVYPGALSPQALRRASRPDRLVRSIAQQLLGPTGVGQVKAWLGRK